MSITWVTEKKRFRFEFVRVINGVRHRTTKLLPKGWSRTQADAYDRTESAKIYAVASGVDKQKHLITEAVRLYLTHKVPHQADGKKTAQCLAILLPYYQGKNLEELDSVCRDYIKDHTGKLKPATIRNRLAYLVSACRYAFKEHQLGEHDPAERVSLPKVRNQRMNYPTRKEMIQAMRKCRHRDARAALCLAFYTGMRWRSEILPARLKNGFLVVPTTKNTLPHMIPVHRKALIHARRLPFGIKSWQLYKYIKEAFQATGNGHLTMHDQRHGTASTLINKGATLSEVGAFLNHTSPQATARYAHLVMDTKKKLLEKLA